MSGRNPAAARPGSAGWLSADQLATVLGLPRPTPEQTRVIEAPLRPALVVAGAGSGKTETMAARVVSLVANGVVGPGEVLGLTFTRKAAGELGARIRARLRMLQEAGGLPEGVRARLAAASGEPEVFTYHAFGGQLINEFGPLVGLEPSETVLTATASWQLARRVVSRWDGDLETELTADTVTERLLALAGGLADHLVSVDAVADRLAELVTLLRSAPPAPRQRNPVHTKLAGPLKSLQDRVWILPLVHAYEQAKRRAGALDFADQMHQAARLVGQYPQVRRSVRGRYRVVLLDEYQDTGHAQRVILRAVFGADPDRVGDREERSVPPAVTAVGDPVQSIYSWRGASAANLARFVTDFPDRDGRPAPVMSLLTSFRNPARVLDLANVTSAPLREASTVLVDELRGRTGAPVGRVVTGLLTTVDDENDWLADQIARRWQAAGWSAESTPGGTPTPTTAVLLRRRRDMSAVAESLRACGLPVEVMGLGGLIHEPEVADVIATLRVLVDPHAGDAVLRLLTGPRWRIGMADLRVLADRARLLARDAATTVVPAPDPAPADPGAAGPPAGTIDLADLEREPMSLVDALADLGEPAAYSATGHRRLSRFAAELDRLRSRLDQPLTDVVADVERTIGIDVETALHRPDGRVHLDAFADVVADVAASGVGPPELLDYLATAEEREDGLQPGDTTVTPGAVQILTVHGAKGLEWDTVAVPHLVAGVFPSNRVEHWLQDAAQLPPDLRGDRSDVPVLDLPVGGDQGELARALGEHVDELKAAGLDEERRLMYVAVTRAESMLLLSGHHWGASTAKPLGPSEFLTELSGVPGVEVDCWADPPEPEAINPMTAVPRSATWPVDPLGGQRTTATAGARLVVEAMRRVEPDQPDAPPPPADPLAQPRAPGDGIDDDIDGWRRDVDLLLAERTATAASTSMTVDLPAGLTVSALVDLARDPEQLALRVRRPLPVPPLRTRRRGSAFHDWLQRQSAGQAMLDLGDLPGAGDPGARDDPELERLQAAFQGSSWARRTPVAVELPFSVTVGGLALRGRIDAVYVDDDGGRTVVDWKTGRRPDPEEERIAAVQLAVYRLAVADLFDLPLDQVRAAFHYVRQDRTVMPVDMLDADGLAALIRSATDGEPDDAPSPAGRR
ncbi:ATP-dependent helicase [Nakamurella leprariae]|uniref:DNA 3'-5' helicase n=1 Tax=Nakamurella leprariae TaxID=2803911 RepID=A0A939BUR2_9ACTN|nr:UvrD-helicase domain-containing protein [Nakamurella leprariae]MBM9465788.1 ATP-dependent helicase [Nakamurella leprariae]